MKLSTFWGVKMEFIVSPSHQNSIVAMSTYSCTSNRYVYIKQWVKPANFFFNFNLAACLPACLPACLSLLPIQLKRRRYFKRESVCVCERYVEIPNKKDTQMRKKNFLFRLTIINKYGTGLFVHLNIRQKVSMGGGVVVIVKTLEHERHSSLRKLLADLWLFLSCIIPRPTLYRYTQRRTNSLSLFSLCFLLHALGMR